MPVSRTIGQLWRDAVDAGRTNPAYLVEGEDGWREGSWEEAGTAVEEIANGLLARGIRKGDAFGILAQTNLEWALFDYALARRSEEHTSELQSRFGIWHAV